jgi:hypothetical protein
MGVAEREPMWTAARNPDLRAQFGAHGCEFCVLVAVTKGFDLYECHRYGLPNVRTFTIRAGPVPNGGFAVAHKDGDVFMNPPQGADPLLCQNLIHDFLLLERPDA